MPQIEPRTLEGFRDYLPEQMIPREAPKPTRLLLQGTTSTSVASLAIALLLTSCPAVQADDPSLGEQLEKLVPRAAGLAQVEVVEIEEINLQSGDGPLYLDVRFRTLRSTGVTKDSIHIVKAQGGLRPPGSPEFKPHGPVKLDTFKKGHRYWVAFCSQYDWERYPQAVVNSWPDADVPPLLKEAIRTDHYASRPQYDPKSGLTHSYRADKDKGLWRVRMERDGALLWEVNLPGEKFKGEKFDGEWRLLNREHSSDLANVDENRSGLFLFAETVSRLEAANGYHLPPEKHRLTYALDADSGKTAGIWVSRMGLGPTSDPLVVHYLDSKTGAVRREERYDSLENGGLAAGANEERWLRLSVRIYDLDTQQLKTEEIFRWTASPDGSEFVPVGR